jgi:hypothetical protein
MKKEKNCFASKTKKYDIRKKLFLLLFEKNTGLLFDVEDNLHIL